MQKVLLRGFVVPLVAGALILGLPPAAHSAHAEPPRGYFSTCPDQPQGPEGGAQVATLQCHTVERGEWLWKIARVLPYRELDQHHDGQPSRQQLHDRVKELHRTNRGVIGSNPNRLRPGMVLVVGSHSI